MVHPLALILDDAAHGRFPVADGSVRVLPALPGALDALIAFTGTFALTGALSQADVDARVPRGEFAIPMSAPFVSWVCAQLGAEAFTQDIVFVATSPGRAEGADTELVEVAESEHPRVQVARRYRRDVRMYETIDRRGVAVLGRGITGRWEIAYEVDADARSRGLGRAVARAAVSRLPEGTPVWAQVAPGNTASVRAVIGAGFVPVGAEVLFRRGPQ